MRAGVVIASVALVLGSSTAVLAQTTGGPAALGGFTLDARAQALNVLMDSNDAPSPTHPFFDGSVPAAQSTLSTGPIGHGLAAIFWPGPLGGNFGSALKQLNQFCAPVLPIPGLPPICQPIPQALKDNGQYFNDPFRAETFFPQAPQDSTYPPGSAYPGVTMESHIAKDGTKVESFGSLDGFGAPGVGAIGGLRAHTTSTAAGTTGTVESVSEVSSVILAGGMVTIDSVFSTAKETTDGSQAKGEGGTVIGGLKIGGQAATVDQDGIHLSGSPNNPFPQINQALAQALDKSGIKLVLVPDSATNNGATGSFTAGSLVISYASANDTTLPAGLGSHADFTIALGGALASVDASQGVNPEGAGLPSDEAPTSVSGDTAAVPASLETPPAVGLSLESPASAGPAPSVARSTAPAVLAAHTGGFGGLAWGLIFAALLAAVGAAYGLRRMGDGVFADTAAVAGCPLEQEMPGP